MIILLAIWVILGLVGGFLVLKNDKETHDRLVEKITYYKFIVEHSTVIAALFSIVMSAMLGPILIAFAVYLKKIREKDGMY